MVNLVRHPLIRAGFVFVLLGGLLCASHSCQHAPFSELGKEVWYSPEHESSYSTPADPAIKIFMENMEAKDVIAQDLIAKRLTLSEAVARFRAVDARRPPHVAIRMPETLGDSMEERYARYVTYWARHELKNQPGGEASHARLETELREYLGRLKREDKGDKGTKGTVSGSSD